MRPTAGHGMGGKGQAALLSMLQDCAPGMAVVNIDDGIGAGAIAGLVADRAAAARLGQTDVKEESTRGTGKNRRERYHEGAYRPDIGNTTHNRD